MIYFKKHDKYNGIFIIFIFIALFLSIIFFAHNFSSRTANSLRYIVMEVSVSGLGRKAQDYEQLTSYQVEKEGYTIYGANGTYSASAGTDETYSWKTVKLSSETGYTFDSGYYGFYNSGEGNSYSTSPARFKATVSNFNFDYYDVTAQLFGSNNDHTRTERTEEIKLSKSQTSITAINGSGTTAFIDRQYGWAEFGVNPKKFDATFKLTKNKSSSDSIAYTIPSIKGKYYYGEEFSCSDLDTYLDQLNSDLETDDGEFSIVGYHQDDPYCWWDGNFSQCRSGSELFIYSNEPVYYANFVPNTYTIVYHGNGSTGGSTASSSHTYDTAKALRSNGFTKSGYRFIGWSTSANGSVVYSDGQNVKNLTATDGGTVNLYAKWELIDYSISYTLNGGSHGKNHPTTATYNEVINISNPTREGYTFDGWSASGLSNTAMTGTSSSLSKWNGKATKNTYFANLTTTNNGKVSLTANWTKNGITATLYQNYYPGDSTTIPPPISEYYVPDDDGGTKLNLPSPEREGYKFLGWNTKDDGSGKYYTSETNFNNSSQVVSGHCVATANAGQIKFNLYAIWEANEYSVNVNIYNPNGVEEYTSNINGTFTLTDDEGNVITGLYNEPSDHYITFGESWQVYDIVAGTGRKLRTTNPVTCGSGLTMSQSDGTYTFKCTGTSNHTINIYMEYITYTIAFNSNGGSGNMLNQSFTYDSEQALSTNTFKWAGYVFTGWNRESGGTGKSYLDKETVKNLTSVDGATVTLYAQWEDTWANHASSSLETTEINGVTYNVIASAEDLAYLSKQSISSTLVGKYIQTADIDLSEYTWLPIGSENAFCGEYLGQGHKITGLKTSDSVDAEDVYLQTYGGLFGKLGKNDTTGASANIVGVYITGCQVYGEYSGAIAGLSDVDSINIEACILENIEIEGNTTASFVGLSNAGQIKDCLLISSNISTTDTTTHGFYTGAMTIKSCYFVENNSAIKFTGASSDYSNWIEDVFMYPLPSIIVWYPNN